MNLNGTSEFTSGESSSNCHKCVKNEIRKPVCKLQYKKLSNCAYSSTKESALAAGFDLKSEYNYTVPKRGSCLVKKDIQFKLPINTYGRIALRSGLALHKKLM